MESTNNCTYYKLRKVPPISVAPGRSSVYVTCNQENRCNYIVKVFNEKEKINDILREVKLTQYASDNNFGVNFVDYAICNNIHMMITDKWNIDLGRWLQKNGWPDRYGYFDLKDTNYLINNLEVLKAMVEHLLKKMDDQNFCHGDARPFNIMLKTDTRDNIKDAKFIDFEMSYFKGEQIPILSTTQCDNSRITIDYINEILDHLYTKKKQLQERREPILTQIEQTQRRVNHPQSLSVDHIIESDLFKKKTKAKEPKRLKKYYKPQSTSDVRRLPLTKKSRGKKFFL